jgi:hypothetical protein
VGKSEVEGDRGSRYSALGLSVHSGWGAAVVVALENSRLQILERRRLQIIDASSLGAAQPYHFAAKLDLAAAERHLDSCAKAAGQRALLAVREIVEAIRERGYRLSRAAILLSSGRPLPPLRQIFASHALIHTAEGEFFRHAFCSACEELKIPVTGIRERELNEQGKAAFGKAASRIHTVIASLGRSLGPPWTADQKNATFAAAIVSAATGKSRAS